MLTEVRGKTYISHDQIELLFRLFNFFMTRSRLFVTINAYMQVQHRANPINFVFRTSPRLH